MTLIGIANAVWEQENDVHNSCEFGVRSQLDEEGYQHSTRVFMVDATTCSQFYGENWPYTSGGYNVGYFQGFQPTAIFIAKNTYNTTHAYAYGTVMQPYNDIHSPSVEVYATQ